MALENMRKPSSVNTGLVNNLRYSSCMIDEDIDGLALTVLRDDEISKLLSLTDEYGLRRNPTTRIQRKFRVKLDEYRLLMNEGREKRRRRQ